jgi:hypothetical protein
MGRLLNNELLSHPQRGIQWSLPEAGVCWSNGVLEHRKISNFKHQITNKSQIPILKLPAAPQKRDLRFAPTSQQGNFEM